MRIKAKFVLLKGQCLRGMTIHYGQKNDTVHAEGEDSYEYPARLDNEKILHGDVLEYVVADALRSQTLDYVPDGTLLFWLQWWRYSKRYGAPLQ